MSTSDECPVTPREGRSGLSYEVILDDAAKPERTPKRGGSPPTSGTPKTHEEIQAKLQQAEERRLLLEKQTIETARKEGQKVLKAQQEAAKLEESFKKETEEKLVKDLEEKEANRQARLNCVQERIRKDMEKVEQVGQKLAEKVKQMETSLQHKLTKAEENRKANLTQMQEQLREHVSHVEEVKRSCEESSASAKKEDMEKHLQKLEQAMLNREEQLTKIVQRIKDHELHSEDVRKQRMSRGDSQENDAMETA